MKNKNILGIVELSIKKISKSFKKTILKFLSYIINTLSKYYLKFKIRSVLVQRT